MIVYFRLHLYTRCVIVISERWLNMDIQQLLEEIRNKITDTRRDQNLSQSETTILSIVEDLTLATQELLNESE